MHVEVYIMCVCMNAGCMSRCVWVYVCVVYVCGCGSMTVYVSRFVCVCAGEDMCVCVCMHVGWIHVTYGVDLCAHI